MVSHEAVAEETSMTCPPTIVLSFDVEEHHRIEAASGLTISVEERATHAGRVGLTTRWLLERLAERDLRATFFVVGELARNDPGLVQTIQRAGHEVASHGWDHRRILEMGPVEFREDLRRSVETLRDLTGGPVVGYRAPTFSLVRRTAWAVDLLAEAGIFYDSSIYPVRHDRYGVVDAPRAPFRVRGWEHTLMELPPVLFALGRHRIPAGGGGYFRLFPLAVVRAAVRQTLRQAVPPVAMLYFHPWEFDPEQPRLPLGRMSAFRTYVGMGGARGRFERLLREGRGQAFRTAAEVARLLDGSTALMEFALAGQAILG